MGTSCSTVCICAGIHGTERRHVKYFGRILFLEIIKYLAPHLNYMLFFFI